MAASQKVPSERDLELLSAYLDNNLTERERTALEQRLQHEDILRDTLTDLRDTVALLRALPRLKAPRDFTLDPALYGTKMPWWKRLFALESVLQLSGALGTAAAIILIVFGLLGSGESDSARESVPAAEKVPTSEVAQQNTNTPTIPAAPTQEAPSMETGEEAFGVPSESPPNAALYAADEVGEGYADSAALPTPTSIPDASVRPTTTGANAVEETDAGAAASTLPTTTVESTVSPLPTATGASDAAVPPADTDSSPGGDGETAAQAGEPPEAAMREDLESEGQIAETETVLPQEAPLEPEANGMVEEQAPEDQPVPAPQGALQHAREDSSGEKSGDSSSIRWLAGLGIGLLVVSLAVFFLGHRKARRP